MVKERDWVKFRKQFLKGKQNFEGYYICDYCGVWTRTIEVDHIKRRGSHPELALNPNNLQLTCRQCHSEKDDGLTHY